MNMKISKRFILIVLTSVLFIISCFTVILIMQKEDNQINTNEVQDIPLIYPLIGRYYPKNKDFDCHIELSETDIQLVCTDEEFYKLYTHNIDSYSKEILEQKKEYWKIPHKYVVCSQPDDYHGIAIEWTEKNGRIIMSSGITIINDHTIVYCGELFVLTQTE